MTTTFRILGPLEVRVGDRPVALGGPKPRAVLAMLLLRAGRVVGTDALIDGLWGARPPATARGAVQVYVSQLRRALADAGAGDAAIETAGTGYVIRVAPGALDLARFDARAAEGRAALDADDPAGASEAYAEALALWRGPALADFAYEEFAQPEIAELEERRLTAVEARVDADLRLGRHAELVPELERLVPDPPPPGRRPGQLMRGLSGRGRRGDAPRRVAWPLLADLLLVGIEPGAELRELEGRILRQDPDLLPPRRPRVRPTAPRPRRRRSRAAIAAIAGAIAALAALAVWVAVHDGGGGTPAIPGDALIGIDAGSGSATEPVMLGGSPAGVGVADGAVWVGDVSHGAVKRVDPRRGAVVQTIPVGGGPDGIAAGGAAVWATNAADATLLRISPETDAVVQTIAVPTGPRGVAAADGWVWVASRYARSITRVDAATGEVAWTARIGGSPIGIAAGEGAVWTSHETDGEVWRHDPATGRVQQRIGVGNAPGPIQVGAGAVWVANTLDGTVTRIDPATNAVVATVRVGEGPSALAVAEDGVWVADELGGALVRIDPRRDAVAERIATGQRPSGLAADGATLWVAARDASAAHRGGTLRVSVQGIDGIDQGYSTVSWMNLSGDGLTAYRRAAAPAGASIVPDLASSLPTPTDGGRTYTFTLREGIRYSTGEPVRPGDVRRGIERFFRLGVGVGAAPEYYDRIVGADACRRRPAACDLSRGVVADDAANTVTIHLTEPDPDLLHHLALPFAHAVAPSAPRDAPTTRGLPATGPYVIASHVPGEEVRFVRNPYFQEWSRAARPDGYADEILVTAMDEAAAIRAVERDDMDVALTGPLAPRVIERLAVAHPDRLSVSPIPVTFLVSLDTTRPPFDRLDARRALAFALDRGALVEHAGGARFAQTTCQVLPPGFPGYEPYCPFTRDPGDGRWHSPDLDTARDLVARSGTSGAAVTVRSLPDFAGQAREVAAALRAIGYRAGAVAMPEEEWLAAAYGPPGGTPVQVGVTGWANDYPAPASFFDQLRCGAADPARFCDPAIDARMDAAQKLQVRDPAAADAEWAALDRALTDRAAWIPYANPRETFFTSERAGHVMRHPVWGAALDQLWVR